MFSIAGRMQSIFQQSQSCIVVFLVPDVLPGCHLPGSLCPWAQSILVQLIFQSESLRVRETPLSFPCCRKHPGEDHPLCLEEEPAPVPLQHLSRHPRGCTAGRRKPLELLFGGQHWEEPLAGDVVCGKRSTEPEGGMSCGSSRALPEHPAPPIHAAIHLREMGTAHPRDYSSCTGQSTPNDFPLSHSTAEGLWD